MSDLRAGVRFGLRAPLMSWSETGAAERPTDPVPTWSAIVGLIGAGFGWRRDDVRLVRFANDYRMAVRVDNAGERIEDYHTVQSPERTQAQAMRARTRADELSVGHVHTTITRREYVSGAAYTILVLASDRDPVVAADAIAAALLRPAFSLYAGRKSCALGRIIATVVAGDLQTLLPDATHWDGRIPTSRAASLIRERRDQQTGPRTFVTRFEHVA